MFGLDFLGLLFIFGGFATYFVPSFIASGRNHKNMTAIIALNLLLGWTLLGWVGALVWALSND